VNSLLSALWSPEFLAGTLLAALGILIFVLIRPKEYATEEEFWLALLRPRSKPNRAEKAESVNPGKISQAGNVERPVNRSAGLSGN
jgi:hypothetical protein